MSSSTPSPAFIALSKFDGAWHVLAFGPETYRLHRIGPGRRNRFAPHVLTSAVRFPSARLARQTAKPLTSHPIYVDRAPECRLRPATRPLRYARYT